MLSFQLITNAFIFFLLECNVFFFPGLTHEVIAPRAVLPPVCSSASLPTPAFTRTGVFAGPLPPRRCGHCHPPTGGPWASAPWGEFSSGPEVVSGCLFPLASRPITQELDARSPSIPLRCCQGCGTWRDGGKSPLGEHCCAVAALLPPDTVSCSSVMVSCSPPLLELHRFTLPCALLLSSWACAGQGPVLLH